MPPEFELELLGDFAAAAERNRAGRLARAQEAAAAVSEYAAYDEQTNALRAATAVMEDVDTECVERFAATLELLTVSEDDTVAGGGARKVKRAPNGQRRADAQLPVRKAAPIVAKARGR
eukprot:4044160-Prymnesium_polylepis.1